MVLNVLIKSIFHERIFLNEFVLWFDGYESIVELNCMKILIKHTQNAFNETQI